MSQPKPSTPDIIRSAARRLFASKGYDGVSMRVLAKESGVGLSSIYHFYDDKDVLLKAVYDETNRALGLARRALPPTTSAEQMLHERVAFQFDHIEEIVFVIKYYVHYREVFARLSTKTLPLKSTAHIDEVLHQGFVSGEFDIDEDSIPVLAKMVTHTINGFLIEYYPYPPQGRERQCLIEEIVSFVVPALTIEHSART